MPGPFPCIYPDGDLRSHTVTSAVSSALRGSTSVFGMGTGVTPALRLREMVPEVPDLLEFVQQSSANLRFKIVMSYPKS